MKGSIMLQDLKSQAYDMAEADPLISLVQIFKISDNKDYTGFLIVDKCTPSLEKDEELSAFYFSADDKRIPAATCIINAKDYQKVLRQELRLPENWVLGEILFEGCFIFNDIDKLVKSIRDWGYNVDQADDSLRKVLGFKCKSGRKWEIGLIDLKNSINDSKIAKDFSLSTKESKELFLQYLNTKPPYEKAYTGDKV
jgi:hypothetical protein